ncbi:MAG TPA: enoyl-CoA hydratase-related protein [Candidatus Dormibacteraeota bacterium]|nr:enoyl-CoA hydratase-related protein [Candidatus Dormibacteraeota bacterium]
MQLNEHVSYELEGRVAHVRLTRPEARNALSPAIAEGLVKVVGEVEADRRVRAVVLAGAGTWFCAGGDLKSFAGGGFELGQFDSIHDGLLGLHRLPVPVVAAVEGGAIGYGLGLASACDIRVAAAGARFQAGFTGIGLSLDSTTSFFLPRLLGLSRALGVMLTNLPMTAEDMHIAGYVFAVVEPGKVVEKATELAERIAQMPAAALTRAKRLMHMSLSNSAADQIEQEGRFVMETFQTDDFREGVTAFVEKRKPEFQAEREAN